VISHRYVKLGLAVAAISLAVFMGWRMWVRPHQLHNDVANACSPYTFEGSHFTLCRYDPKFNTMEVAVAQQNGAKLRTFGNLAKHFGSRAKTISFAMNAGMYGIDSAPIGLYIEAGTQRHAINTRSAKGNFYKKPNGVFWSDASGFHIATTEDYIKLAPKNINFATQSGPALVIKGALHPGFQQDGQSRKTRNGVGITGRGDILFAISEDRVSFGKFARLYRDALDCPDALYFDGTVSALWNAADGRITQPYPLGPFIVVMDKRSKHD
jgi:uncharacterized protein YigE (DUF2233 family)